MAISGMWMEANAEGYWKTTVTLIVLAAAFAHVLLLWIPTLAPKYRWSQAAVVVSVAVLALQILLAVWGETRDVGFYRAMGVVAVLVVLFTLIVPICAKLSGGEEAKDGRLVLTQVDGEVYRDASGVRYRVSRDKPVS